jgi:phospholipase C
MDTLPLWLVVPAGIMAASTCTGATRPTTPNPITHVIIIMQENHSFDNYFGTYPNANGIPQGTCVPINPSEPDLGCVVPYEDVHDAGPGGPHGAATAQADIDDGISHAYMDGFVYSEITNACGKRGSCSGTVFPSRAPLPHGAATYAVMGYHTAAEIPNYWAYASHFVLQDAMFEGIRGWSGVSHNDLVSEWSAICTNKKRASTCVTSSGSSAPKPSTIYPWANLFQLMDLNGVSWKYYLGEGTEPDCEDGELTCAPEPQQSKLPGYWNPAPYFAWVQAQGPTYLQQHNPSVDQFLLDVANGTLPQVSWIIPSEQYSEHPNAGSDAGMDYVTSMVNAVMQSPYWQNTAIFITWDDWGGFYDHVVPPNADYNSTANPVQGFGLRVPGLLISAYAQAGYIDNSVLSFDSYATFVENLFMNGARLNPTALGNPDSRPDIRDELTSVTYWDGSTAPIGDLMDEFDFVDPPQPQLILSTHIPSNIQVSCIANGAIRNTERCNSTTVTISWASIQGPNMPGTFIYHLQRDGLDLPQCVGTANSCVDTPGIGNHLYRAYSIDPNNVTSPLSAAAEADVTKK